MACCFVVFFVVWVLGFFFPKSIASEKRKLLKVLG